MLRGVVIMIGAALLETTGIAMIRDGLARQWLFLAAGAVTLVIYGILVNQGSLDYGRLMGCYIAIFFVVSQVIALLFFQEVPAARTLVGGALIVAGGLTILT
ncbi:MAG TPA: hypothetical protein VMD75_12255 [Candidatus Binataceae bacterium]|nr:hypothetical protein [Candidatus Binataceae bacterium]